MKTFCLFVFSLLLSTSLIGQHKHHFDFSLGRYSAFETYKFYANKEILQIAQLKYQFDFNKKTGIYFAINKAPIGCLLFAAERVLADTNGIGKRWAWGKYCFYDIGISYKIYNLKNHKLSATAAFSYAKGEDIYLKYMIWISSWSGGPGFHIIEWNNENRNAAYKGGVIGLRYDFYFNKERCKIGTFLSARYYGNDFPFQINYGMGLGYVFSRKIK